jgi:pimeloyl-ACP methyl ester carboxylesterase
MSSGAVLSLRAAASGLNIKKLALYQPPFIVDTNARRPPVNLESELREKLAAGRRGEAVKLFLTKAMGMPVIIASIFRFMPIWSNFTAVAHTLPYDVAVMGDTVKGGPLSAKEWEPVSIPTLAIDGSRSPAVSRQAVDTLVAVLPNAQRRTLEGQSHDVSMDMLAPVLETFFQDRSSNEGRPL